MTPRLLLILIGLGLAVGPGLPRAASGHAGPDPAAAPERRASVPPLDAARIDALVRRHVARSGLPGVAVAVVHDGQIAYTAGVGEGRSGNPITADTPFMISSLSKAVTALAAMQLVDSGVLTLDDRLVDHLPDLRLGTTPRQRAWASEITLRHLLHHRSGLSVATSFTDPPRDLPGCNPCLGHVPLSTRPGTDFGYTNLNYGLLGRAMEAATGRPFADLLHRRVGRPLEASALFAERSRAEREGLAPPHRYLFGLPVRFAPMDLHESATPAGLLAASARDLGRVGAMLLDNGRFRGREVLPPAAVDTLLAPWPRYETGYAMGWGVGFWEGERILRHGGMLPGYSAFMALLPDRRMGVVVLANVNSAIALPARNQLAYDILQVATGADPGPVIPFERLARFSVLLLTLGALGWLAHHARRWWRQGRPTSVQWTARAVGLASLQIAAPLLFVGWPTTYYGVSPLRMVGFQPDLGAAALILSAALLADAPLQLWTKRGNRA